MINMKEVRQRIVAERKVQGLKQFELAKLSGISQSALCHFERGDRQNQQGVTVAVLYNIVSALGMDFNYAITGDKSMYSSEFNNETNAFAHRFQKLGEDKKKALFSILSVFEEFTGK